MNDNCPSSDIDIHKIVQMSARFHLPPKERKFDTQQGQLLCSL